MALHHVQRWVVLVVVTLVLAHTITQIGKHALGYPSIFGLVPLFDLDSEGNLPTWFASLLLLTCALLLAVIASAERTPTGRWAGHWRGLAGVFLILSADEVSQLHGLLTQPVRWALGISDGVLYFAWPVPVAGALLLLGAAYLPFFRALPAPTRRGFLAGGLLYVGGALGMELPGGWWYAERGQTAGYTVMVTVEEVLEFAGSVVFLGTLVRYLAARCAVLTVGFEPYAGDGRIVADACAEPWPRAWANPGGSGTP